MVDQFCESAAIDDEVLAPGTGQWLSRRSPSMPPDRSVIHGSRRHRRPTRQQGLDHDHHPNRPDPLRAAHAGLLGTRLTAPTTGAWYYPVDGCSAGVFDKVVLARGAVDQRRSTCHAAPAGRPLATAGRSACAADRSDSGAARTARRRRVMSCAGRHRAAGRQLAAWSRVRRRARTRLRRDLGGAAFGHIAPASTSGRAEVLYDWRAVTPRHRTSTVLVDETCVIRHRGALHNVSRRCVRNPGTCDAVHPQPGELDRGRYASSVRSRFDTNSDGEFGITALRSDRADRTSDRTSRRMRHRRAPATRSKIRVETGGDALGARGLNPHVESVNRGYSREA